MPVRHHVDEAKGLLVVVRSGQTSPEEEDASFQARADDPNLFEGMPVLVDNSGVEPADSIETIQRVAYLVSHNAKRLRCGRTALVVHSDVEYGMARMLMALVDQEHPDMQVFRSTPAAMAWLRARAVTEHAS